MLRRLRSVKAVSLLAVVTVISIGISAALLLWDLRTRAISQSETSSVNLTRMFMEQTDKSFDAVDLSLQSIQERLQSDYGRQFALDSMPVHLLLNTRSAGLNQLTSLFVVDEKGTTVNTSRAMPFSPVDVRDRAYFQYFATDQQDGLFIGKPSRNRIDQTWTLYIARKITGPDKKFRGVVVAAFNISRLEQLFNVLKLDYARPIALYMSDGTLIGSMPHRENMIGELPPELESEKMPQKPNELLLIEHRDGHGDRQQFTLGRTNHFPLLVSVTNDPYEALASWRETAIPIALGALMVCLIVGGVASLLVVESLREEKLAKALREAHVRYQHTIDSVMDAIVAVNGEQKISLFNPAAERMFKMSARDAIGKDLNTLIPHRFHGTHHGRVTGFIQSGGAPRTMSLVPQLEITGMRSDGSEFPIESTISQTMIGEERQLTAVLRDATERRRAEREMFDLNDQLRKLSTALQNVREEERARISRELHDELGQQLTGLKLDLSWLSNRLKEGRLTSHDKVDEMRRNLNEAISSVRRISAELRPLILDDLGFMEAVTWQTQEFAKRTGLQVSLNLQASDLVTADKLATALFRIVQESLTNVVRHAQATEGHIHLLMDDKDLILRVQDNGQGLDVHAKQTGIGLVSMRERATALGGRFQIQSDAITGTTVEVRFDLHLPIFSEKAA